MQLRSVILPFAAAHNRPGGKVPGNRAMQPSEELTVTGSVATTMDTPPLRSGPRCRDATCDQIGHRRHSGSRRRGADAMTMRRPGAFRDNDRAVAMVEFAMIAPVLALLVAGAAVYGFREWSRSCLANAVAQGAYYAFRTGPNVSATNVQTLVQSASSLTGVSIHRITAPACYCPSGTPASLGSVVTCGLTCTDGTTAGKYLAITATYSLVSFFPSYTGLGNQTLTESVTVRLQ